MLTDQGITSKRVTLGKMRPLLANANVGVAKLNINFSSLSLSGFGSSVRSGSSNEVISRDPRAGNCLRNYPSTLLEGTTKLLQESRTERM